MALGRGRRVGFRVIIERKDFSGCRVDFIIILCVPGIKFHIVLVASVIPFQLHLHVYGV